MDKRISSHTREELVRVLGRRYRDSSKMAKTLILNEPVAVSGYRRKHVIRLLGSEGNNGHMQMPSCEVCHNRRIHDEVVKEAHFCQGVSSTFRQENPQDQNSLSTFSLVPTA